MSNDKQLYWINKKGVFSDAGKDIKYGDKFNVDVGKDRLKKLIADGKVGEILTTVTKESDGGDGVLKIQIAEIKKAAATQLNDVKKEYDDKIAALDTEIIELKKIAESGSEELVKENTELKKQIENKKGFLGLGKDKQLEKLDELEKENAELKEMVNENPKG